MSHDRTAPKNSIEHSRKRKSNASLKAAAHLHNNNYTDHYIHTGALPQKNVRNTDNPVEGYPNLQKLFRLKEKQIANHSSAPYGCRLDIDEMVPTLKNWIHNEKIVFDVVMIGCLTDNQFIYPLLTGLPIDKLISKPGFLFIWGSAQKINELTRLLQNDGWAKKFRKSEELVFIPIDKKSPFYPGLDNDDQVLFEKMQWHCWMCITGTVRRATDGHLIHCNVDTDLSIETESTRKSAIPSHLYKVAENFSTATRRLHIIPARTGTETPVKVRPGWVIMSPDVMLNNFDSKRYREDINKVGAHLPIRNEIELLRPKSPVQKRNS
ncbi:Kar4p [Lachancea thermotolerans CBS 6340]|uniref:KLTH0F00660p n=1 Tax=Lachancea thermotolerans (strain ATCC 56472 / CBS 6340 / NRRL Y-8284) TaxID=559295 RepID=C5DJZ9_LACTC|nr:KLTH0F00660p [Lachancea thermotolerans CBS 6340]CAR23800.1 KLTH0F00660p [Lachancea thermotolerans CBS 6340]